MKSVVKHSDLVRREVTDYKKVGRVSSVSVLNHTGKDWKQWIAILDKAGARSWSYQEIVAFVKKKYRSVSPWWQHGLALGFEIATGRRQEGQDFRGRYSVTATKSLAHPASTVWNFVTSHEGMKFWLKPLSSVEMKSQAQFETTDGYFGEIRTVQRARRARIYWQDPNWEKRTVVELYTVERPGRKSILVFSHTGLADLKTKDRLRVRWRDAVDQLSERMLKEMRQ